MTDQRKPFADSRDDGPERSTRRGFVRSAALGAAGLAATGSLGSPVAGAEERKPKTKKKPKTKIRIGTRISAAWMKSENDNDLRFLKQIGVDYVDITLDLIDGYSEHGEFTRRELERLIKRFDNVGLKIERANSRGRYYLNAHLARPEGQKEIDKLKRMAELLVDSEIPVYGIQACQASLHLENNTDRWIRRRGRGGYRYLHFDLDRVQSLGLKPKYKVTSDQLWKGLLDIYRQVIPIVDGSKTKVAMHGNDPPIHDFVGSAQILCRHRDFDRLFSEVPSANNGITFCCGTRYESGEDVLKGIEHFGKRKQLFHVHFRNVRGTLPDDRGYSEVFVDDGDMPMGDVVRALDAVGYDGVIDFDHPVGITGEGQLSKQYISFAVGYMRGLLHNL